MFVADGFTVATNCTIFKKEKTMSYTNCNCRPAVLTATDISTTNGITTITLADDALTGVTRCDTVQIGLFRHVPCESSCTIIKVTDGTSTYTIFRDTQYWRPCNLKCRSILVTTFLDDPDALVLRTVKGGCL